MRIAHLLRKYDPAAWGGTETVVLRLLTGLRQHRVHGEVFAPRTAAEPTHDPLAEAGFPVRRYEAVVPVWGISEAARQQMITIGGNIVSFELMGTLWREKGLSVVHSHALGRIGGIGLTVARRRKIPFVVSIHGGVYDLAEQVQRELSPPAASGFEWGKLFGLLVRSRRLLDDADAILTGNPREAELIRERHPRTRVLVQPHSVDVAAYRTDHRAAAKAAFPWLDGAKVLLVVSRISAVKNQGWLVDRLPALLQREPRTVVVLAGASTEPAYSTQLEQHIRDLGLQERVKLVGGLPTGDPRLIGLMQLSRAMVLPSHAETFGLVILEAWAAGTPMLASITAGSKSLITSGVNGVLFDLNRPLAFNEAAVSALKDDGWRGSIAAAARNRVEREFDTRVIAAQVKSLYDELINERQGLTRAAG